MKRIRAYIEGNGHNLYSVYIDEDLPFGIIGEGYTIEEAKNDFLNVYQEMRKNHKIRTKEDIVLQFDFVMDASAFLQHYKGILTLSGLSGIVGINKAQLSQYVCGTRHPSPKTQAKIKKAITDFAEEIRQALA